MARRRRRLEIFFILYLTAIVGFVVVSKDREHRDQRMIRHNEHTVRTLLPQVPVYLEADTVRWYVSADSSGIITGELPRLTQRVFVRDIWPDDQISLSLHSVVLNGVFHSSDNIDIGDRTAIGSVYDHTVYFPVTAEFARTGLYHINLIAQARRIHERTQGSFEYHGLRFDTSIVSRSMITSLEEAGVTLSVRVIDTSITQPKTLEALSIEADRRSISSAIGFEETNILRGNLGWSLPDVRIIQGSGRLEKLPGSDRSVRYQWTGTVSSLPDTVVIESRLHRSAGGKDIARTRFSVSGTMPYLRRSLPSVLYAGEDLLLDIGVAGLEDEEQYRWSLLEAAGEGDFLLKSEGRGSRVQYRIPNSYGGKELVVDARYGDRSYRYISSRTHKAGRSRFVLPVQNPPTQISTDFPARGPVTASYRFSASRYIDPRFRGEQPIDRLADVRVELFDEENNLIRTDVSMIRKGEFTFIIQDKDFIRDSGEHVIVRIHAEDASVQTIMELYR